VKTLWWLPLIAVGCDGSPVEGGSQLPAPPAPIDAQGNPTDPADPSDPGPPPAEGVDSDGDGWLDTEEVDGNTDPLDAEDHPYTGGWPIGACRDSLTATGNGLGEVSDDFELLDQYGEMVRLHDFCDKEVLLVGAAFW